MHVTKENRYAILDQEYYNSHKILIFGFVCEIMYN